MEHQEVLAGRRDPYTIKWDDEEVKAGDLKYGSDRIIIVALPNEVNMVAKQSFKKPTRESIMATPQGRSLRRSDVLNSPC
ncbi:MAG: hypothetical protein LQ341_005559 [Variospora aurantia]|nr:MAG: hypothetical protein LQ341_005559 [Variospora aurantia]